MDFSTFSVYLELGGEHIADLNGYDHILFVTALCAVYTWQNWRAVIGLVTAFTLGHSLTLALTVLDVIPLRADLIEFLIPVTILLTCIYTLLAAQTDAENRMELIRRYGLAAGFGLIHGMGFANFLRSLLGGEEDILLPLFAFNIGLELGQLLIVAVVLTLSWLAVKVLKLPFLYWKNGVSALVGIVAIRLIAQTWIF